MNLKTYLQTIIFCCSILLSAPLLAFSTTPDSPQEYAPTNWQLSQSATRDAEIAVKNNDLRLLGFAGRNFTIPGIEPAQAKDYANLCNVRYFKEFSDVIRDNQTIELKKKAKLYALEYNSIILNSCTLTK